MKPIVASEMPALEFNGQKNSHKIRTQSNKIGWVHSISDEKGAKFDLTIKDALGRTMMQKLNCGGDTERYGELVNLETHLGDEIEVVVENIKNAKKIDLFIN